MVQVLKVSKGDGKCFFGVLDDNSVNQPHKNFLTFDKNGVVVV